MVQQHFGLAADSSVAVSGMPASTELLYS